MQWLKMESLFTHHEFQKLKESYGDVHRSPIRKYGCIVAIYKRTKSNRQIGSLTFGEMNTKSTLLTKSFVIPTYPNGPKTHAMKKVLQHKFVSFYGSKLL